MELKLILMNIVWYGGLTITAGVLLVWGVIIAHFLNPIWFFRCFFTWVGWVGIIIFCNATKIITPSLIPYFFDGNRSDMTAIMLLVAFFPFIPIINDLRLVVVLLWASSVYLVYTIM